MLATPGISSSNKQNSDYDTLITVLQHISHRKILVIMSATPGILSSNKQNSDHDILITVLQHISHRNILVIMPYP